MLTVLLFPIFIDHLCIFLINKSTAQLIVVFVFLFSYYI